MRASLTKVAVRPSPKLPVRTASGVILVLAKARAEEAGAAARSGVPLHLVFVPQPGCHVPALPRRFRSRRLPPRPGPGALVRPDVPARFFLRGGAGRIPPSARAPAGQPRCAGRPAVLRHARGDRRRTHLVHVVLRRHRLDLDRAADPVQGVGRRHELPRRPARRAGRGLVVVAQAEAALLRHHRLRGAAGAARAGPGPARQFHQRRVVGQAQRRVVGDDLPGCRGIPRSCTRCCWKAW